VQRSLVYRPDIDGLRAVAVLTVVFFHAGIATFSGGYAGVDVFFVISGYLMGALIWSDASAGTFSFKAFFERRARRILPALFFTILFWGVVACIVVPPKLLADMGSAAWATVAFSANIAFWHKTANYFDTPAEWNPLLHTWSLSAEGQFYLVFPILAVVAAGYGRRASSAAVLAAALASFLVSLWAVANAPTAAFYLLPARAWELLAGAWLALMHFAPASSVERRMRPIVRHGLGLLGLGLICACAVFYDRETAFPGLAALPPCLGAVLIIHAGQGARGLAARLLSTPPVRFIGLISYSLYLWHWPIIVFSQKYDLFGFPASIQTLCIIAASLVCAYASWRWIEQPFRKRQILGTRPALAYGLIATGAVFMGFGFLTSYSGGWPGRFPDLAALSMDKQIVKEEAEAHQAGFPASGCFVYSPQEWGQEKCYLTKGNANNALLWGDSFAASYAYGFFASSTRWMNILQYTSGQCPPIIGYEASSRPTCGPINSWVEDIIKKYNIHTVIMAANWSSYFRRRKMSYDDIHRTEEFLHRLGVEVIVIGQSPIFKFSYPDEYALKTHGYYKAAPDVEPAFNDRLKSSLSHSLFVDALRPFCDAGECLFREGGFYLFGDYGHYTHLGSIKAVTALISSIVAGSRAS
jgi:peptidoglycan/LPS O-acetylase OafA/YrhL